MLRSAPPSRSSAPPSRRAPACLWATAGSPGGCLRSSSAARWGWAAPTWPWSSARWSWTGSGVILNRSLGKNGRVMLDEFFLLPSSTRAQLWRPGLFCRVAPDTVEPRPVFKVIQTLISKLPNGQQLMEEVKHKHSKCPNVCIFKFMLRWNIFVLLLIDVVRKIM